MTGRSRKENQMTTVAEILRAKGNSTIYSVSPSDTMLAALQLMAEKALARCWCWKVARSPAS
jgi:hypothetical protein